MAATDIWPDLKRLLTVLGSWGLKVQPQLAAIALTHSSYAHEHGTQANERLSSWRCSSGADRKRVFV